MIIFKYFRNYQNQINKSLLKIIIIIIIKMKVKLIDSSLLNNKKMKNNWLYQIKINNKAFNNFVYYKSVIKLVQQKLKL